MESKRRKNETKEEEKGLLMNVHMKSSRDSDSDK